MKTKNKLFMRSAFVITFLVFNISISLSQGASNLNGSWQLKNDQGEEILIFIDDYFTHTAFNRSAKSFEYTRGGSIGVTNNEIAAAIEFNSKSKDEVGEEKKYSFSIKNNVLTTDINGKSMEWKRVDDGAAPLAGVWRITDRKQEGKIVPIHQSGTRKTLKILTGSRFQWAAIDPGTKEFSGTGGGTYSFKDGKYIENIEFFSRDGSRVGAKLSFDGKLENGKWHHSGLSSKGDQIYEVWGRVKP